MNDHSDLAPDRPELAPNPLEFPVVGIGASAGGLEAFGAFLGAVDAEFEAAYVLVQHLDPNHESMLTELLSRYTELRVTQIENGMEIRPREVYIIPSASALTIEDGVLNLVDFEAPRGFRRPIDDFFQALAIDQGPNAAAIVLSGTGGDGTVGIRHIKEAGGLTIVQSPEEAAYDGMPASAIATGLVDFVLPINEMVDTITRYYTTREQQSDAAGFDRGEFLADVMQAVRDQTGHDFSYYKINTVLRRIQRRMQVLDLVKPADYVAVLRDKITEAEALFQDLLINVTSFFRDPEVFDYLRREVIPQIVKSASPERPIRIWVPGCSSGEEAYSIAILLAEALSRAKTKPDVQIFATDIDEEMLMRARSATYMQSVVSDLPPELLTRYFTATEEGYTVIPSIRDMVRVSAHSVIKDPPFSRLDLVSCRNLLIYFDNRLQSRVLPLFHYALRPDGWLLLGSAENLAGRDDLFNTEAREERIYRRSPKSHSNFILPLDTRPRDSTRRVNTQTFQTLREGRDERESRVVRRAMDRYVLPHVVVDPQGQLLMTSSRTAPFLNVLVEGQSLRLLDLVPSELRPALRSMLGAMTERRRRVIRRGIEMSIGDDEVLTIDLIADPLDSHETMVVFREMSRRMSDEDDADADIGDFQAEERIEELEDELSETRSRLRTTVEELETSNEELKSSNEEMMSMNEELQSANEELSTVNEELKSKLDELALLNADQANFLESTQIATVFVDKRMRVRSFTPVARKLFRFVDRDKGRPLLDVRTSIESEALQDAIASALEGTPSEAIQLEVDAATYTFRALPYLDHDGAVDGAVLVFDDVSQLVRSQAEALTLEQAAARSQREIEKLYESAPIGMALVDRERRYKRINESLATYNGRTQEDHLGRTVTEVLPEIGPKLDAVFDQVFKTGKGVSRWELIAPAPQGPRDQDEVFELDIYPLLDANAEVERVGLIVHRVTEARRMESDLRHVMAELQHRVKNSLATVVSIVRQTARNTADPARIPEILAHRINALASTHALLTAADWGAVDMARIVEQEISPYRQGNDISVDGPDVSVAAKGAISLTLIIHELATNATKYGALKNGDGRLAVSWAIENDEFELVWHEEGLADVESPTQHGFGTKFIERTATHDLDGTADLTWSPSGLIATIRTPLLAITQGERDD